MWIPQHGVWFTGRYRVVEQVFRDPETFVSSAGTGLTNTKTTKNWRKPSVILENDPGAHEVPARHDVGAQPAGGPSSH